MFRPRVCMVDPFEASQALVRKVLGKYCDLIFLDDALRLMDVLEVFQPDLIILELELPSLSGFELIHMVQQEEAFRHIPIMVFSGQTDLESQKQAYRLGALNFQTKPCRPSQVFKSAALFMRLASGEEPKRRYTMQEVERVLGERQSDPPAHPLLNQALTAHQTMPRGESRHYEHVVLATVAASRPRNSKP